MAWIMNLNKNRVFETKRMRYSSECLLSAERGFFSCNDLYINVLERTFYYECSKNTQEV